MLIYLIMQSAQTFLEKLIELFKFTLFVFVGYFSPIHDVVHVVMFMFFVDVIYGWRVAVRLRQERFNPRIVWVKTMPRVVLSLLALILAYVIDRETGQTWINTFAIIGWSISALLFLSIIKNGYILTKWQPFKVLGSILNQRMQKETGVEIDPEKI